MKTYKRLVTFEPKKIYGGPSLYKIPFTEFVATEDWILRFTEPSDAETYDPDDLKFDYQDYAVYDWSAVTVDTPFVVADTPKDLFSDSELCIRYFAFIKFGVFYAWSSGHKSADTTHITPWKCVRPATPEEVAMYGNRVD